MIKKKAYFWLRYANICKYEEILFNISLTLIKTIVLIDILHMYILANFNTC